MARLHVAAARGPARGGAASRHHIMYRTGEEAYSTRQTLYEGRLQREARERDAQLRTGEGSTRPLSVVPELDRYLFDLQGYLVIQGAVGPEELALLNEQVDLNDPMPGRALGLGSREALAMMANPHNPALKELQQGFGEDIPALGTHACFDRLIDHPSWIAHIRDFVAGGDTRMTGGGGVTCRWPGQASGMHGATIGAQNNTFSWVPVEAPSRGANSASGAGTVGARPSVGQPGVEPAMRAGRFRCQTVSVLLALNDCPAGGGGTTVVPGSHKSNIRHPFQDAEAGRPQLLWRSAEPCARRHGREVREGGYMDGVPGSVELTARAGDAVLLVESCLHGSCVRTLPGCRRTLLLRYGPREKGGWQAPYHVFQRLSPPARALIHPQPAAAVDPAELAPDAGGRVRFHHHGDAVRRQAPAKLRRPGGAAKL